MVDKVSLTGLKEFRYAGKAVVAGTQFDASRRDARLLVALDKAEYEKQQMRPIAAALRTKAPKKAAKTPATPTPPTPPPATTEAPQGASPTTPAPAPWVAGNPPTGDGSAAPSPKSDEPTTAPIEDLRAEYKQLTSADPDIKWSVERLTVEIAKLNRG